MAPNGTAAGRKAPVAGHKTGKNDTATVTDDIFDDYRDHSSTKVAKGVDKKQPPLKDPGKWNSEFLQGKLPDAVPPITSINKVSLSLKKAFLNGKPMLDKPDNIKCNHCKRAVSKLSMPKHIEGCLNKKQEKQRKKKEAKDARDAAARKERAGDSDEDDDDSAKKTASKNGGLTASKKRKVADDEDDGPPTKKKKKKEDPKAKAPKTKPPVDVEKQCGVELPQGGQCARSLTCKSHSMGAKRAVPGRSAPYDKLLLEYQRKNQAKLHKAAFDANAPNPDDDSIPSGPIDSEEEKDAVVSSIARAFGGEPIYQPMYVPLRRKYEYNRIRGMMQSAFGGGLSDNIFGVGGAGAGALPLFPTTNLETESATHSRKVSGVSNARSMMAPGSRKPSIASGA